MKKVLFSALLLIIGCQAAFAETFVVGELTYDILYAANKSVAVAQGNYSALTSVDIPESVTYDNVPYTVKSIGKDAFRNCSGLTSVTIPNSVTIIGYSAFENCSGLTSVTIGNSVTSIGDNAFYGCSGLTSVTIPNSVTTIGDYAFSDCTGLTSVTIGNSVTSIGNYAFYCCSGLARVTIGNSVTSIGDDAFYGCTGLTSVTIPNSVTTIGDFAFCLCSGLTSVTIPNSVTTIGNHAFYGCSGLTSVTIPNSVTSIGNMAFCKCSGLESISVESGNTIYDSRNNCNAIIETATNTLIVGCKNTIIPNSVTTIGGSAFSGCTGLTSVTIPNSVTSIGIGAFNGTAWYDNQPDGLIYAGLVAYIYKGTMPSGTSITLKDGTKGITGSAFYYCTGLTSVTIPNSVTSIGNWAFMYCKGLQRIEAYPDPQQVVMGNKVFYNVPKDGTLHVLPKYLSAYQTADQWREFTKIAADLTEGVKRGDVNGDGEVGATDIACVVNVLAGLEDAAQYGGRADVTGDGGAVTSTDVASIVNILAGLEQ